MEDERGSGIDARRGLRALGTPARNDGDETDERFVRGLVARAKGGDAYVLRIVVNRDDADDVTQQIFAKLLTELGRYQPREAPFRAWVLRVARNVAIDHLRGARAVPCEEVRSHHDRA